MTRNDPEGTIEGITKREIGNVKRISEKKTFKTYREVNQAHTRKNGVAKERAGGS